MAAIAKPLLFAGLVAGAVAAALALGGNGAAKAPAPSVAQPAIAQTVAAPAVGSACQVPDQFLRLTGGLDRTETLITDRRPVRVVMMDASATAHRVLEAALERRIPGARFEIAAVSSAGLAVEDGQSIRRILQQVKPDLVVWPVGVRDALASSDVGAFGDALDATLAWSEAAGADLLLVDPPFVPRVQHESLYAPYVSEIAAIGQEEQVPVLRRYAAMRYLSEDAPRILSVADQRPCALDLMAEAISRVVR
ncbi:SGNH/GDSL hydrolase family protein [Aureimonas jatrophae]|uniref:GDSL-like Lipase/Acylhydrolase family protein n=1 Tax=Aureimonas jatrophae TaxID=1166073 RepID=A0A1H0EPT7_9HYPH|nr:SGNH/GDSL hydrolase family protein [Aureimonas jatrophae]MBB3950386.1 hypothetical protein [Aureimonas jatrophae]SDN84313.1 hypothetical protein SAMN05192530_102150 [Aureimonas jatrophae]